MAGTPAHRQEWKNSRGDVRGSSAVQRHKPHGRAHRIRGRFDENDGPIDGRRGRVRDETVPRAFTCSQGIRDRYRDVGCGYQCRAQSRSRLRGTLYDVGEVDSDELGDARGCQNSDELDQANVTIAALRNSTSEAYVKKHLPKAKLVTIEKYDAAIQMVIKDEVDALVADMPACILAVLRYPDQGLETLSAPLTVEPVGIAVPASELSLQSLLDNYLRAFEDSGLLELLRVQWLENGDWVDQLP